MNFEKVAVRSPRSLFHLPSPKPRALNTDWDTEVAVEQHGNSQSI